MVNIPPVCALITSRDKPYKGGIIYKLQELDRLMTGGAAVGIQEEEKIRSEAMRGSGADGPGIRDMFPQLPMLPSVSQEDSVSPHLQQKISRFFQ